SDAKFFANLAYQTAFLSQACFLRDLQPDRAVHSLQHAASDFATALELGYPTESVEICTWFYRSLVANDNSLAHFIAALPWRVWTHGFTFPRTIAGWGFAVLRGQGHRVAAILELLYGLCFEVDEPPPTDENAHQQHELQKNLYSLIEAISKQDSHGATEAL